MLELLVLLSLLSALLTGIGVAMERRGLSRLPEITPGTVARNPLGVLRTLIFCKIWIGGWIIAQIGWALMVQAFHIGDLNVVKTLASLSIVVTTVLGIRLLHEKLNPVEKVGIALVTVGTISVSLQSQTTKQGNVDLLAFVVFNAIAMLVAVGLVVASGFMSKKPGIAIWEVASATGAGIFYSVSTIFQYLATYGAGGQNEFNILSIQSWMAFVLNLPFVMGYAILLLGFFSFQSAMSRGRASIAYPITTSFSIALPVLGSAVIFGEMIIVPLDGYVQFPLSFLRLIGIIVTVMGGALVQSHSWRLFSADKSRRDSSEHSQLKRTS